MHFCKENLVVQKCCVWCFLCCPLSNILLVLNIFLWKMFSITFCWCKNAVFFALQKTKMRTFCFAEHFPLENVMLNILLRKMYALLNIFLWKMYAKMHFCIKCIFASNAFLHQIHFCIKSIFASTKCYKCIFATHS